MSTRRNKKVDPSQIAKFKPWVTVLLPSQEFKPYTSKVSKSPKPKTKPHR